MVRSSCCVFKRAHMFFLFLSEKQGSHGVRRGALPGFGGPGGRLPRLTASGQLPHPVFSFRLPVPSPPGHSIPHPLLWHRPPLRCCAFGWEVGAAASSFPPGPARVKTPWSAELQGCVERGFTLSFSSLYTRLLPTLSGKAPASLTAAARGGLGWPGVLWRSAWRTPSTAQESRLLFF